jgi:abhydrolase domain-containing protein 6
MLRTGAGNQREIAAAILKILESGPHHRPSSLLMAETGPDPWPLPLTPSVDTGGAATPNPPDDVRTTARPSAGSRVGGGSVWDRWVAGARGLVFSGLNRLIESLRAEYRSRAGLVELSAQVGAHSIAYLDRPLARSRPAVLLLHGFCGDKDLWLWFAAEFPAAEFRLIIPDLPGFGDSSRIDEEQYDVRAQSHRIVEFATSVGAEQFHIVGNSMGGNIAGRIAIDWPERVLSLTLMDALGAGSPVLSDTGQMILQGQNPLLLTSVDQFETFLHLIFVKPPPLPAFVLKHLAEKIVQHKEFNRKVFFDLAANDDDLTSELGHILAPTLVLWGAQDRVIDVSASDLFENGINNSERVILQECGHVPLAEQPEASAGAVLTFIRNLAPTAVIQTSLNNT